MGRWLGELILGPLLIFRGCPPGHTAKAIFSSHVGGDFRDPSFLGCRTLPDFEDPLILEFPPQAAHLRTFSPQSCSSSCCEVRPLGVVVAWGKGNPPCPPPATPWSSTTLPHPCPLWVALHCWERTWGGSWGLSEGDMGDSGPPPSCTSGPGAVLGQG